VERLKDLLLRRKQAYTQTFASPVAKVVLSDLAYFCRAAESTFDPDPRVHALLEGRREVWLRIVQHLNLTNEQLFGILAEGKSLKEAIRD